MIVGDMWADLSISEHVDLLEFVSLEFIHSGVKNEKHWDSDCLVNGTKGQWKIARLVQAARKEALDLYLHDVIQYAAATWLDNQTTAWMCIGVFNTVDPEFIVKAKVCI